MKEFGKELPEWGRLLMALSALFLCGCSAAHYREKIEGKAYEIIHEKQLQAYGEAEEFTIERPEDTLRRRLLLDQLLPYSAPASLGSAFLPEPPHWPEPDESPEPAALPDAPSAASMMTLDLIDSLQIAALNNRQYQSRKEQVFATALRLELERDEFRVSWAGLLSALFSHNRTALAVPGGEVNESLEASATLDASQLLKTGPAYSLRLGFNLLKLLEPRRFTSESVFGDASISIPLWRGAGRHIVSEPLTQAERDVVYALNDFERFKREFAVDVASRFLSVLQARNQVQNAAENYRGVIASSRRAQRVLDAGKLPPIQVDQSLQEELSARNRWVSARESYASALDGFKAFLGLPPDAAIELDQTELDKLALATEPLTSEAAGLETEGPVPPADAPIELVEPSTEDADPFEANPEYAIQVALTNRLDLQNAIGRVHDAQRAVVVAADQLKPEVTLFGSASVSGEDAAGFDPDTGSYSALLNLDLPFERTAEAAAYRQSYIALEEAVRGLQALEDDIKLAVLDRLRELREARESLRIQALAVELARRRVRGASLNLEAGRVEIRDLLEAQEDLLGAQNALTAAMVDYRVAELALRRDLGLLEVSPDGSWTENES